MKSVILLSGGLDSCVTLAKSIDMGYKPYPIHINYNHLTMAREEQAFNDICDYYKIDKNNRLVVNISYLSDIGGSALTDVSVPLEIGTIPQSINNQTPNSYVPFRNGNMLAIAVSYAEVIKAEKIFIGAVEEDSSGYPDCRKVFFDRFNALLEIGLSNDNKIEILTPVIDMKKSEIIKTGLKLKAPLELTWSCYQSEDKSCGVCESCYLRLRGFSEAGLVDKIEYR